MELRFWIRAFGDSVEVLKPKKLRDEFKQISQRMKKLYE
jgi:predicted DNA-binding transcriptional regulator YafY